MKKFFLSAFVICISILGYSQNYLGIINNNFSGLSSVYFNPAMGNKTMLSLNLVGFNANIYNNYIRATDFHLFKAINDKSYFNDSTGWNVDKNVTERINGNPKYATATIDLRGPGILVGIGKFQVGYLWKRVRVGFQISGVEEQLARNLFYIGRTTLIDIANIRFSTNKFAINMNAWTENGITGAYAIKDDKKSMIRIGATIKSLNGLGAMYIKNNGSNFSFYRQPNSTSTDSVLTANYDMEFGFTNEFSYADNPSDQLDTFTSSHSVDSKEQSIGFQNAILKNKKKLGHGTSFDLGVVYEKRDGKKNRYKYRLAVSLIDIGSIKYDNLKVTYVTKYKGTSDVTISDGLKGYNSRQYDTAIAKRFNSVPGKFQAFTMALPTTLNISFDYRLINKVYLNATWIQSVRSKYAQGIRSFSSLSITPRFETKVFSAALPIVLNDDYRNMNLGICISVLNCLYIGSDNIGGAFGIGSIAGTDFYGGLMINISKHKKKTSEKAGTTANPEVKKDNKPATDGSDKKEEKSNSDDKKEKKESKPKKAKKLE